MSNALLIKNSVFLSLSRFSARALGLVSTFVVARILTPEDYGVIAIAMIVQDFALRMQNVGFSQNIISAKNINKQFLSSVLLMRIIFFAFLTILVFLCAPLAALLLNSQEAYEVVRVICWIILINGFNNIEINLRAKHGDFKPEIKAMIASKIISIAMTIYLANLLGNYWALAYGMLFASLAQLIFSYVFATPFLPGRCSWFEMKSSISFSKWFFLQNIVMFFNTKVAQLMVGRYFGEKILGLYSMAENIVYMYGQEIAASFDKANFTHLSDGLAKNDKSKHNTIIAENTNYITQVKNILIVPVYAYCAVYSDFVIGILLGDNWSNLSSFFSIFCLAAILLSYETTLRTVFNALRRPNLNFKLATVRLLSLAMLMFLSVYYGNYWIIIYGTLASNLLVVLAAIYILNVVCSVRLYRNFVELIITVIIFASTALICSFITNNDFISTSIFASLTIALVYMMGQKFRNQFVLELIDKYNKKMRLKRR